MIEGKECEKGHLCGLIREYSKMEEKRRTRRSNLIHKISILSILQLRVATMFTSIYLP